MMDIFETGTRYLAVEGDDRTARYAESTLLIVGILFSGSGEIGYQEVCNALGMYGFSAESNYHYFWRLYHAAEEVVKESMTICHDRMKSEKRWEKLIGLFDGMWLHRGYASQHGSSAILDLATGCILFLCHKSKDKSKFGRVPHNMSSSMMEITGLDEMLDLAAVLKAKFSLIAADADSGTQKTITDRGIKL